MKLWIKILIAGAVIFTILWWQSARDYAAFENACKAKGGHLSSGTIQSDHYGTMTFCLSTDGRILE